MTLEKRIETAIAENIDPFTTDADIRFFETEEWNAAKVTLGTKIIGDFGGYTELWNGKVVAVECFNVGPAEKEVKVEWDNGSTTWMAESEIDDNKGKIGYFTEEGFYE